MNRIVTMEQLDFCRAINELPFITKVLLRLIIGRYAMHEFYIMWHNCKDAGYSPSIWYGCEDCDYNKKPIPILWWKEKHVLDRT